MVKPYLNKLALLLAVLVLFILPMRVQADGYSDFFVKITDATGAVKSGEQARANQLVQELAVDFENVDNHTSTAGQKVSQALAVRGDVTEEQLVAISTALLAFNKEQHPVDEAAEKEKLIQKLTPAYEAVQAAIDKQDIEAVKLAYKKLNTTWTNNEQIVRQSSTSHYGKIETSLAFLRSANETEPVDFEMIQSSFDDVKAAVDAFLKGEEITSSQTSELTLKDGIDMLEEARRLFQKGQDKEASRIMKEFITIWPTIEGAVSTRNASLYTKVESETPIIMVRGSEKAYQAKLSNLIEELSSIDTSASYNFIDAMLILLREGVEALLIVMALVVTLKASQMRKGLIWVYTGAGLGILASVVLAVVLQVLFPALASGAQREIIEGAVGIFAVIMMLVIGVWLHSKSSVKKWNDFMKAQMQTVVTTGSFMSLFALSFLAVFREGAETILFYVGIVPYITLTQFLLGVGLALIILAILAFVMTRASQYFSPHRIFFYLTWLIYGLAFKMLGVSLHALQLTGVLSTHVIKGLPTLSWLGVYPTVEVLVAQLLFIFILLVIIWRQKEKAHDR